MPFHLQNPKTTFLKELIQRRFQAIPFVLYRTKWHLLPKFNLISDFPLHVDIEVTNKCNLRCTMCVQASKEGRKNQGEINFNMACNILEAIGNGRVFSVKFNWMGEPMLYRKLPDLIAYAKSQKVPEVQLNSNGTLLTPQLSRDLIKAGLDRIIFSVDGFSSATYDKIRIGGKYTDLLKNLNKFLELKGNKVRPFVRVQMCVGKENQHEVPAFIDYWSHLGVQVGIIDRQDRRGQLSKKSVESVGPIKVGCRQPWQRLTISHEGKVFPCCADWGQSFPLVWKVTQTDTSEQIREGLHLAWIQGKGITQVREAIQSGKVQNTLCGKCPFVISNGKKE